MTPAALSAAAKGDLENFMVASTPGGIEAQEKAGQIRQSFEETLPKEGCDKAAMESLGFKFIGEGEGQDKIFWKCQFPKGWRKQPTEHSMWSNLIDDKGRTRASIFFKAAFYDYKAHMRLEARYGTKSDDLTEGLESVFDSKGNYRKGLDYKSAVNERTQVVDTSTGAILFTSEPNRRPDWKDREAAKKLSDKHESEYNRALAWLCEHFPDWRKPEAYWD